MVKKTVIIWLLLCSMLRAQNFAGASPEMLRRAEEARKQSMAYWGFNGTTPQCSLEVYQSQDAGGYTNFTIGPSGVSNANMHVGSVGMQSTIPHEVDHLVRATVVQGKIPRWLDEGSATLFEQPEESAKLYGMAQQVNWITPAMLEAGNGEVEAAYADPNRVMGIYTFGYTATQMLLERNTQHTLIAFQKDSRPVSEKFPDYYGLSSEQFVNYWRTRVVTPEFCQNRLQWVPYPAGYPRIDRRPLLEIWTAPSWCAPCQCFEKDLESDPAFKAALVSRFHIHFRNFDNKWLEVEKVLKGVTKVPMFLVPASRARVLGYSSNLPPAERKKKLLDELLGPNAPKPYIRQETPPAIGPPVSAAPPPAVVSPPPIPVVVTPSPSPDTQTLPDAPEWPVTPPNSGKVPEVVPAPPKPVQGQPGASTGTLEQPQKGKSGGLLSWTGSFVKNNWMGLAGAALLLTGAGGTIGGALLYKWGVSKIGTIATNVAIGVVEKRFGHKGEQPPDVGVTVPSLPPPIPPICPPEPVPAPVVPQEKEKQVVLTASDIPETQVVSVVDEIWRKAMVYAHRQMLEKYGSNVKEVSCTLKEFISHVRQSAGKQIDITQS